MKIVDILESSGQYKFLKPGELRQSYTDSMLIGMGFKKSSNGAWYILKSKWDKLVSSGALRESASGYIPSEKEKNDPRFKTALTVDITPDSIKDNAKKLGLGNIHRSGIPKLANPNGKIK